MKIPFALLLAIAPAADAGFYRALRAADLRLATIGHRLAVANAPLCDRLSPAPGLVLHAIDQYPAADRPAARAAFGFPVPVAVEAVVAGSAAARAGVRDDDGVVAIGGRPLTPPSSADEPTAVTRNAALALLAGQPATGPVTFRLRQNGADRAVTVPASAGCRTDFELLLGPAMTADADGQKVRIGVRFLERYADAEVAAVVAHELAHNVLHHRERLEKAGVKWGLLAEIGRNGRLFRRTEDEADQLSVALLRNAGYDPRVAAGFWRRHGGDVDGGFFRSRTHASSKARAAAIDAEIARTPAGASATYRPSLIATRGQPLS